MKLFVYGPTMSGMSAHGMLANATLEVPDLYVEGFRLIDLGLLPAMVPSKGHAVRGELWDVPPERVIEIDRFEGAPRVFKRTTVEHELGTLCVAYVLNASEDTSEAVDVPNGDWRAYDARSEPDL